jgi:hypothetical protein
VKGFPGYLVIIVISCYSHIPHPTPPDAIEIAILSGRGDRMKGLMRGRN